MQCARVESLEGLCPGAPLQSVAPYFNPLTGRVDLAGLCFENGDDHLLFLTRDNGSWRVEEDLDLPTHGFSLSLVPPQPEGPAADLWALQSSGTPTLFHVLSGASAHQAVTGSLPLESGYAQVYLAAVGQFVSGDWGDVAALQINASGQADLQLLPEYPDAGLGPATSLPASTDCVGEAPVLLADGGGDLLVVGTASCRSGPRLQVLHPGPSGFTADAPDAFNVPGYYGLIDLPAQGDLNGDGLTDLVAEVQINPNADPQCWAAVFLNQGGDAFGSPSIVPMGPLCLNGGVGTGAADLDADGRVDVVIHGLFLQGQGDGTLGDPRPFATADGGGEAFSLQGIADLDGDGVPDLVDPSSVYFGPCR